MLEFFSFISGLTIAVGFIDFLLAIFVNVFKEVRYNKSHYEDRMNGFFYWLSITVIIVLLAINIIIPLIPLNYDLTAATTIIYIAETIIYHVAIKEVEKA